MGLAGGPLRAWPATLSARIRLVAGLPGRLGLAAMVGGALFGLDPVDGHAGPLPVSPLGRVVGLGAKRPNWISDVVGAPVLLELGSGVAPDPPTPGRLGNWPKRLQDVAGAVGFDCQAGGAPLPGQGPYDLPILRTQLSVGLQPALAALLVLTQLTLPIMRPIHLLGRDRQPTRHPGGLITAAT